MKKIISIILIVSMIFTMGGFATLADSIPDVVGADIIRPNDGANDDTVGADTIRPNDDTNDDTVGADIIRPNDGANDDIVGADIIRPNDGANDDIVGADTIRPINGSDLLSTKSDIDDEIEEETVTDYAEEPEKDETTASLDTESIVDEIDTTTKEDATENSTNNIEQTLVSEETNVADTVGANDDTDGANDDNVGANDNTVGADTIRPTNDGANDDNVGANDNSVGADIIRPTNDANDDTNVTNDNINVANDDTNVANDDTDGANADTVGADIIRPTDGDNQQNNDDNKYNISTNSNAEEILNSDENVTSTENTKLDIDNINFATISEVLENINVASESQIDLEVVSNENIATTSTLNLATFSELSSNNLLSENIASDSEINIASNSEINIASISNIIIEQNIASLSEIKNIASLSEIKNIASSSQLLGEGGNNLPWKFYFGVYPQSDGSGVQYEPIEWRIISQDGSEALVYSYMLLGGSTYGRAGSKWETGGARAYLQNEFIKKAFSENQINHCIIEKTLQTGDEITRDKVFLMMPEDVPKIDLNKYAYSTEYAKSQGARPLLTLTSDWWLRKPTAYFDGIWRKIDDTNNLRKDWVKGIRPTMYLNTSLPVFESSHSINFNLDFASWKSQSSLWKEFTSYYGGQKLPTTANLSLPDEVDLAGWSKDGTYENLMSEIPLDCTEDLSLKAIFKSNIVYDLTDGTTGRSGSWDGNEGASFYYIGKTFTLPTNVKAPEATEEEMEEGFYKFFDHWEMDGKAVNAIPAGTKGVINLKAVYKSLPEYVWFGTYPQNDISGVELEPIRWRVIKQDGKEAILVSEKILDYRGFKNENVATTWEDSDIRTWLNDTFLNKAFTLNQINKNIVNKNLTTPTLSGNIETEDKVFSLSKDEYHGGGISFGIIDKQGRGTEYAKNVTWNGSTITMGIGRTSPWWLRSQQTTGIEANQADKVMQGAPSVDKANVNDGAGIRPFISVDLTEGKFKSSSNGVTWNLGPARFKDKSALWNDYNAYQIGQKLPTEENLVIPDGLRFVGFRNTNNKEVITEIPADTIGDITLKLQFKGNITWNLTDGNTGNVGSWNGEAGPTYYDTEFGIETLPTNVNGPANRTFDHWEINGKKVTSIESGTTGDKEIRAVYKNTVYNITWDLTDGTTGNTGSWDGDAGPSSYECTVGINPLPTNVVGPKGKMFDHWEIGGVATTSITTKDFGDKKIKAVYDYYNYEYVWLGVYPQNDKDGQQLEPIKWRVIHKDSDKILLLSDKVIDRKAHHINATTDTYATSLIRNWLNQDFLKQAFSTIQSNSIVDTSTVTEDSSVKDKIFLLSLDELNYLPSNDRDANYTKYSSNIDSKRSDNAWWLRSSRVLLMFGVNISVYYAVAPNNKIREFTAYSELYGIRPALYLDISDSSIYRKNNNHINFNLNGGSWKEGSVLWEEMDTYIGGQKLPTAANINVPDDKEFKGFVIKGTNIIINEIPLNYKGDIELVAIYGKQYNITWDLKDGNTSNEGLWDGAAGPSTYYSGLGLSSLPTNVIGPTGRDFDHWEINGVRVTNISSTDSGNKTIKAVYKNKSYEIHWSLSGGSFENNYTAPTSYEYSVGLDLTEARNKYVPQTGKKLNRWLLQFEGETTTTPATTISRTANKKVTVIAECTNASYNITYVDENGNNITWDGTTGPSTYTYGTGVTYIPTNINPPEHKEFDHWEIEGVRVDSIGSTETGNKTVVAKYRNKKYKITWNLNQTYPLYDPSIDDDIDITIYGDWENEPGADSYTYGEGYVLPATTSVVPTPGFIVDGWSIEDSTEPMSTEISDVDFGDKVVQVIYRTEEYNVTWNLNGAVLTNDADVSPMHPSVYGYGDVHAM